MDESSRALVSMILVGLVAGWLASIVVGGGGLVQYLLSGLIGSFVGGYLLDAVGVELGVKNPTFSRVVKATIGAIVVVLLARILA